MATNAYQEMWNRRKRARWAQFDRKQKAIKDALEKAKKLCTCCKQELSLSQFDEDHRSMTGYASVCKQCKSSRTKKKG